MKIVLLDKEKFKDVLENIDLTDVTPSSKLSITVDYNCLQLRTITINKTVYVELK